MIDRVALGYVVDMIDFRLIHFAVFNVADSFVSVGAVMLVITGLLLIIAGIILDVMAKNDRKTFVIDTNKIAYNKRH